LKERGAVKLGSLEGRRNGEDITVAGIVMSLRPMRSRKGDRWAIVSLQDMSGSVEVLAFPESFGRLENTLKSGVPLLLKGRVSVEDAGTRVILQEAKTLDHMADAGDSPQMKVRVDLRAMDDFTLDQLKELFARSPGPCPVSFVVVDSEGAAATLRLNQRVRVHDALVDAVRQMCGADAVEVVR
jgi:DNA polymerase-3 subunit alpha